MPDKINIASTKQQMDAKAEAEYLLKLDTSSENIKKVFHDQQAHATVSEVFPGFLLPLTYEPMKGAVGSGEI